MKTLFSILTLCGLISACSAAPSESRSEGTKKKKAADEASGEQEESEGIEPEGEEDKDNEVVDPTEEEGDEPQEGAAAKETPCPKAVPYSLDGMWGQHAATVSLTGSADAPELTRTVGGAAQVIKITPISEAERKALFKAHPEWAKLRCSAILAKSYTRTESGNTATITADPAFPVFLTTVVTPQVILEELKTALTLENIKVNYTRGTLNPQFVMKVVIAQAQPGDAEENGIKATFSADHDSFSTFKILDGTVMGDMKYLAPKAGGPPLSVEIQLNPSNTAHFP